MTIDEARALKPGDRVMVPHKKGQIAARVILVADYGNFLVVETRRPGVTRGGAKFSALRWDPSNIHFPPPGSITDANIFADWLEENGHPAAAQALRLAFPMIAEE